MEKLGNKLCKTDKTETGFVRFWEREREREIKLVNLIDENWINYVQVLWSIYTSSDVTN